MYENDPVDLVGCKSDALRHELTQWKFFFLSS